MKKIYMLAAAVAALFAYGCGGGGSDTGGGTGPSYLRVIQASPNTGAVDVEVRSASYGTLAYTDGTPAAGQAAATIASGPAVFDFFSHSTSASILSDAQALQGNHVYTEILAGLTGGSATDDLRTIFVDDNRNELDPAKAYTRFVNASPLLDAVDIYVTAPGASIAAASPTVSSLARYAVSDRVTVPVGSVEIRICDAGSKTPIIDLTGTAVANAYSVSVTENNDSNDGVILVSY